MQTHGLFKKLSYYSFEPGFSNSPQLGDYQIWGQTFLLFTILSDTLLLLSSSLGSILHLGDVSPIVQQEVIIHVLQLVHGLHVLQPTACKASMLHPACSRAMVRVLKEPALVQVRQKEHLGSSSKRVLNISHYWFCGEAKVNALPWPESLCCLGKLTHILSHFGTNIRKSWNHTSPCQ